MQPLQKGTVMQARAQTAPQRVALQRIFHDVPKILRVKTTEQHLIEIQLLIEYITKAQVILQFYTCIKHFKLVTLPLPYNHH